MKLLFTIGAFLLVPAPAQARDRHDQETICVSVLTIWSGTGAEIRAIETIPVPDSYRRMFAAGPCNTLHKPSLIDWHFAFGTEASVTAALTFLETKMTPGIPSPAAFLAGAGPASRRARPRLAALGALRQMPDGDARWRKAIEADPTIRALQPLARSYAASVFLATQHLRAAEFHRSAALLARVRPYLQVASEDIRVFFDDALVSLSREPSGAQALNLFIGDVNTVRDIEARAAVLQAELTRAPADVDEASRLLDRGDTGLLRAAADHAYDKGDSVCDVGDRADLAAITTACDNENDFEGRLLAYWTVRARLELLTATPDGRQIAGDHAEKLLRYRLIDPSQRWSVRFGGYGDALADLYVWRADRAARAGDRSQKSDALRLLVEAERLTSPAVHPGRFGQIADRYATIWQTLEAAPDPGDRPLANPALAREAAYMARTRAILSAIAGGLP